jgi:hypothetical protein
MISASGVLTEDLSISIVQSSMWPWTNNAAISLSPGRTCIIAAISPGNARRQPGGGGAIRTGTSRRGNTADASSLNSSASVAALSSAAILSWRDLRLGSSSTWAVESSRHLPAVPTRSHPLTGSLPAIQLTRCKRDCGSFMRRSLPTATGLDSRMVRSTTVYYQMVALLLTIDKIRMLG